MGAKKLKWDMPPMRLLKFNVDASCVNREDGEGYKAGVGGILRDYEGEMVLSVKASMLASIAHHAEAEFYAVQLALEVLLENNRNVLNTIIETDSEEVFKKLSNPMILDSEFNSKHKIINKILAMRPTNTKLLVSHVKRQCNEIADKLAADGVLLPEGEKVLYYNTLDMGDEYVKKIYDEKRGFLHTRRARTF
ncbi:hypothetical protein CASFOL_037607 [Castilleja foliolosa]|uniref:RNase H type-1 domain-containing protein n=1 Tax=Castilleja foliolosa TaxID=1961234 RepID=A0ABD3BM41_9LAMI